MARPRKKPLEDTLVEQLETVEATEELTVEPIKVPDLPVEKSDNPMNADPGIWDEIDDTEDIIKLIPGELYYEVFDVDHSLGYVLDGSEELIKFLEGNKAELNTWIEMLKEEINDDTELLRINLPDQVGKYKSVLQYQNQNGYAPLGPEFKNMMDYYKAQHPTSSEEEIAIAVFGDLRFSFVPFRPNANL